VVIVAPALLILLVPTSALHGPPETRHYDGRRACVVVLARHLGHQVLQSRGVDAVVMTGSGLSIR
jgi:hypothetical protein